MVVSAGKGSAKRRSASTRQQLRLRPYVFERDAGVEYRNLIKAAGGYLPAFDVTGSMRNPQNIAAKKPQQGHILRGEGQMVQETAMKKLLSPLIATILAASFALPLNAAPIFVPTTSPQVRADAIEPVGHRRHWRHQHWRAERYHYKRRHAFRHCRYYGDCYPYRYYGRYYPRYYGYRHYYPRYYHRPGFSIYLEF